MTRSPYLARLPVLLVAALSIALLSACAHTPASSAARAAGGPTAAVAMPDAYSADVARAVLESGGNAIDAAVAAAFTLAVTLPEAGNIGGGGFMLIDLGDDAIFLDYRETAPAAASRDMYLDENGDVIADLSVVGHLAAGTPGTVRGMWEAHQRYGTLPWRRLLMPAVELAEGGFEVHPQLARYATDKAGSLAGLTNFSVYYGALVPGETFRQPQLGRVLRRIAEQGPEDFYTGETADLIVAEMKRGGGLVTAADLADYTVAWRKPLRVPWRNYTVLSAPPPSSGGIALLQLLSMKEALAPAFHGQAHNSPQYIHLVAEIEKRVFADRAIYLGDPDFIDVPVAQLLQPDYLAARAAEVRIDSISPTAGIRGGLEAHDTTHFSIIDASGNAVANTFTLNTEFGSGVVVEGGGFLLNNEMDDFSAKPGVPNFYGVVGNEANAIAPRKRMLSSMTPTILKQDGLVRMVLGSPGGSTIITTVFQVMTNILDFDMSALEAAGATRFHHQLLPPDRITYDPGLPLPDATIEALTERGYDVRPHPWPLGDMQVIYMAGERREAASDPRERGKSWVAAPAER